MSWMIKTVVQNNHNKFINNAEINNTLNHDFIYSFTDRLGSLSRNYSCKCGASITIHSKKILFSIKSRTGFLPWPVSCEERIMRNILS